MIPTATLSQAHDSNVWPLQYHPPSYLFVSTSNGHTTRFWSTEWLGEGGGGGVGASGEKPTDGEWDGEDEEDMMVPGFGGGGWKEEDNKYGQSVGGGFSQSDSGCRGGGGDGWAVSRYPDSVMPELAGEEEEGAEKNMILAGTRITMTLISGDAVVAVVAEGTGIGHNRDSGYGGGEYGGGGGGGGRSGRWGGRRENR
ncbi:pre-mRNA cleavage and polyadenylation factor (CPF) complex subunit [Marasmius crinis-equi]|uniref:Pre-mRNA cleavage and polyadenylation factor (CPF) complex subunit n=1 Tax=Marasmius crinis-equi TaxID=585013 RepID=A0ABR3FYS1_9AGAR